MSDQRLAWSDSEKSLLINLRHRLPIATIKELTDAFNMSNHHVRSTTAVRTKLRMLGLSRRPLSSVRIPVIPTTLRNSGLLERSKVSVKVSMKVSNPRQCDRALARERQRDTIALLERILKEAILSSEATEILGSQPTTVPKAAVYQMIPTFEASPTETTQIAKTLAESGTSISIERQSESAQQLLPSLAPNLHQLGEHESQTPARICGTEVSNQRHQSGSRSGHSRSYATSKPTNVYGHAESAQVTESRRITQNKVRESPLRRTQFTK
ncbi:hypothetical protein WAI453_006490 [Rhynchosporium graminicola]